MVKGKVILFALLLVFATSLSAGEVDGCNSDVYLSGPAPPPLQLNVCPAGDCDPYEVNGNHIYLLVKDVANNGIPNIPWTDYWMGPCDDQYSLCICPCGIYADSLTNDNGETTISSTIGAGGCVLSGGIWFSVQNQTIMDLAATPPCSVPDCIALVIKSPDRNADCVVDMLDFAAFAAAYGSSTGSPNYDPCLDFNTDTYINMLDFSMFAAHYGHGCL